MRVDLPSGRTVDIKERLTWPERNRCRDATSGEDFFQGFATTLVNVYAPDVDLATLDAEDGDVLFKAALELWKGSPDPKGTDATSSST